MRVKNKPGVKIAEVRPRRMWFGVNTSVSVGSEETVVSGLEFITASTSQVKVDKVSSLSIVVPITL